MADPVSNASSTQRTNATVGTAEANGPSANAVAEMKGGEVSPADKKSGTIDFAAVKKMLDGMKAQQQQIEEKLRKLDKQNEDAMSQIRHIKA